MNRIFLTIIAVVMFLNASLYDEVMIRKPDIEVLRSLDIDETFIADKELQKLLNNYNSYQKTRFMQILSDAYIYFPLIQETLTKEGLPASLVFMAMAESSFNNRAYSKRRATGIWQFMPRTARLSGLKIDMYVDERRDPIKATKAAIKYLKHLYRFFNKKWYLAVLAYNCGEGRVRWAIKRARSDKLKDLLKVKRGKRKQYLPKETRHYIRKIIAMASISRSENILGDTGNLHFLNRGMSYPMAIVKVSAGTTLKEIASAIFMKEKEVKALNPALRYGFVPPYAKEFKIYIPYNKLAVFKENFVRKNPKEKYVLYSVKKGDNLSIIGRKFGINWRIIRDFNHMKGTFLREKQVLIIPVEKIRRFEYVVQNGDSLISIARKFGMKLDVLKKLNNKTNMIYAGEKLIVERKN